MEKRLLPAYPLFVHDPYFSIWSTSDNLNETDTIFWTGETKRTYGVLIVDDKIYSFLGNVEYVEKLKQTDIKVGLFNTDYIFEQDDFEFSISFISPLVLNDLRLMSRPVSYLKYKFNSKKKNNVKVVISLDEDYCYNKKSEEDYVIGGAFEFPEYQLSYFGLNRQKPMSQSFDRVSADWGYYYLTGKESFFTSKESFNKLLTTKKIEYIYQNDSDEKMLISFNEYENTSSIDGKILVAYDDLCSIFYYGEWLKGYYFKDNDVTIFDAIGEAYNDDKITFTKMDIFENGFMDQIKSFDDDYKLLCFASYRQAIAAHKLVENKNHEILFLSKECGSNGCIATVDVTYPSMPLFLLYNPELVSGMIRPIFEFAKMPVWNFDFAPHDAGTFPYCLGQTYGLKGGCTDYRFLGNSIQRNRANGIVVTHPYFYMFPKNSDIYRFESQMPIEESSNMIIISYAALLRGANRKLYLDNYDLLYKWAKYLCSTGLVPFNQLCTDDFHSRIDKNVNLSIKAIVALKAFTKITDLLQLDTNIHDITDTYHKYINEFYENFGDLDHMPLSYYGDLNSYSTKYNLAYDKVLKLGIFKEETFRKEVDYYLTKNNHFGVNLDSRTDLLKTDWLLYASALTDDKEKMKKIYSGAANYLREGVSRVPFTDLYHTETGIRKDFQNRTVQGGIFINLLKEELK